MSKKMKMIKPTTRNDDIREASKIRVKPLAAAIGHICQNWAVMLELYNVK